MTQGYVISVYEHIPPIVVLEKPPFGLLSVMYLICAEVVTKIEAED